MRTKTRINSILLCVLFAALLLPNRALAVGSIAPAQDCSLTISFRSGGAAVSGAQFDLYRVADISSDGSYTLIAPFSSYPIDVEQLAALAFTLEGFILRDGLTPLASGVTNGDGRVVFPELIAGIYLVRSRDLRQNGYIYSTAPFLVSLPTTNNGTEWLYDVEAVVKGTTAPDVPTGGEENVSRKVLKVWDDDGLEAERPAQIAVYLLRDGMIFDTVTLSKENNWTHTWPKLETGYEWTVVEAVPEGYTVTVEQAGITFVITNTKQSEAPDPTHSVPSAPDIPGETDVSDAPTAPDSPTLPETGQLWWPVPVLAAGGLFLFLLGYLRKRGED